MKISMQKFLCVVLVCLLFVCTCIFINDTRTTATLNLQGQLNATSEKAESVEDPATSTQQDLFSSEEESAYTSESSDEPVVSETASETESTEAEETNRSVAKVSPDLVQAYNEVMDYANRQNAGLEMDLNTFVENYDTEQYDNLSEYTQAYYKTIQSLNSTDQSSSNRKWYYGTGATLPQQASYTKYRLLYTLEPGDIIHEAKGGRGITGHSAIVEGIYYDQAKNQYYIRIIEALHDMGIVRSVLCDDRIDDASVSVYRVSNATSTQKHYAVAFCVAQLGKGYKLDLAKNTSIHETDWYCSELIWAAYKSQGIDIEGRRLFNEPGVTPRDIINGSNVFKVKFK